VLLDPPELPPELPLVAELLSQPAPSTRTRPAAPVIAQDNVRRKGPIATEWR
jgi:hypothetical protein